MTKNQFGAQLPAQAREEFDKYVSWWRDGAKTEIDADDEEAVEEARDADPRFVASLVYLGTRGGSSMFFEPGFTDPDQADVERWVVSEKALPFGAELLAADFIGPCTLCGGSEEDGIAGDQNCAMCSGDGSAQYWFEDFLADSH
jgi:hypothetical protein